MTTGTPSNPGYDYQYQLEANGYPSLGYHPSWSIEDLRYMPQNLVIMFGELPAMMPDIKPDTLGFSAPQPLCTARAPGAALFDPECPIALPIDIGMSLLLSAPVCSWRCSRSDGGRGRA